MRPDAIERPPHSPLRRATIAFVALLLTGCAVHTRVTSLGGYRYIVTARADAFRDRAELLEAVHREAARVCDGWRYEVVDRADGSKRSYHTTSDGKHAYTTQRLDTTLVFDCVPPSDVRESRAAGQP